MRKSPLLSPLFSHTMQAVLAATILRPHHEWYLSDLAGHLKVRPSSLQRALATLTEAGILCRRADGNRIYYGVNPDCPILPELAGILTKTIGIVEPLREALVPLKKQIVLAFIHGSIAESREQSESDIDLIVVGDVASADLAVALRRPQETLGRPINATRYSLLEFQSKIVGGHHFLSSVLQKPKMFVIGGEDDLERIARGKARGGRAHQQAGAR